MIPSLNFEMVIALSGHPDSSFPHLSPRGKEPRNSTSQLTLSQTQSSSAVLHRELRRAPASSLLSIKEWERTTKELSIRRLRLDLIEMLRISLHAVDYATKAYALGRVEFALSVPSGRKRLEHLSQTIISTTQEMYEANATDDPQLGFSESARAISAALFSICQHAYEVASHTVALLRGGTHQNSKELIQAGERIHASLRLCIVAFMKQKVEFAEAVLRDIDQWRHDSVEKSWQPEYPAPAMLAGGVHEWSIAGSFKQMMENLCTVAVASTITTPLSA